MSFLQLVLLLDKTIEGINSILPIVSYRNRGVCPEGVCPGVSVRGSLSPTGMPSCFLWRRNDFRIYTNLHQASYTKDFCSM